ncbi:MAG: hypothetical protein M1481_02450 [Candidatus Thermoplasmatota archaeon]|jgi:DNA-binding Lrp family transcriptional regulator|nr:hypothetical protein [Candidatus Thermoplasmatota archaeon]MCL5963839.1 hypothetical protein [Candidatus Thermoplasmatota archaeon]
MIDDKDREKEAGKMVSGEDILNETAKGLSVVERPFLRIAEKLGIEESHLLKVLNKLKVDGKIIKIRALLNYEKLGYTVNALIAINTEEPEKIYKGISSHVNISHAYERIPDSVKFPYNLFLMCHFKSEEELNHLTALLHESHEKFVILKTLKRIKHSNTEV